MLIFRTASTGNENQKRVDAETKKIMDAGDLVIKLYRKCYGKTAKPKAPVRRVGVPTAVCEKSMKPLVAKGKSVSHGTTYVTSDMNGLYD
jgi:hypothetical protein